MKGQVGEILIHVGLHTLGASSICTGNTPSGRVFFWGGGEGNVCGAHFVLYSYMSDRGSSPLPKRGARSLVCCVSDD